MPNPFSDSSRFPLLLDGAMGTELERRGIAIGGPAWAASALVTAPHVVRAVHADYLASGADIITTNTFRVSPRAIAESGQNQAWQDLLLVAAQLAFEARDRYRDPRPVAVAGSLGPLGDCYDPNAVPDSTTLQQEHGDRARILAATGVDLLLGETLGSVREIKAVAHASAETHLPFALSFLIRDEQHLLSGESISEAVSAALPYHPSALLLNCAPVQIMLPALHILMTESEALPCGCYANIGNPLIPLSDSTMHRSCDTLTYSDDAAQWISAGASVIGGCCGTTPDEIQSIARRLGRIQTTPTPYIDPRSQRHTLLPTIEEFYDL